MKIYVINLKRRPDRLEPIVKSFQQFGFTNYEIIEAVDGNLFTNERETKYKQSLAVRLNRDLTNGEIGCALSHQHCYEKILNSGKGAIIVEDDITVTKELVEFANAECVTNAHVIMLGAYTSNKIYSFRQEYKYEMMVISSSSRLYLKKDDYFNVGKFKCHRIDDQSYKIDYLHGTHCYYVSPEGAKIMRAFNKKVAVEADNVWSYVPIKFDIFSVYPLITVFGDNANYNSDIAAERNKMTQTLSNSPLYRARRDNPMWGR